MMDERERRKGKKKGMILEKKTRPKTEFNIRFSVSKACGNFWRRGKQKGTKEKKMRRILQCKNVLTLPEKIYIPLPPVTFLIDGTLYILHNRYKRVHLSIIHPKRAKANE